MVINPAQLQIFFFGLLVFFVVLRLVAFGMTRQKATKDTERIARLEQKVDAIMRRLDMQDTGATSYVDSTNSLSPWASAVPAPAASTRGTDNATKVSSLDDVISTIRAGNKIAAIKLYRERTGVGLKEAKDAVEGLERKL